jgi:tetratricopeptide (TPR) repeat protein
LTIQSHGLRARLGLWASWAIAAISFLTGITLAILFGIEMLWPAPKEEPSVTPTMVQARLREARRPQELHRPALRSQHERTQEPPANLPRPADPRPEAPSVVKPPAERDEPTSPDADPRPASWDEPEPKERPAPPRPLLRTLEEFNQHLAANPDDAAAYYGRGNVFLEKRNYDQAIKDYGKAIEFDPQLTEAYSQRELAYKLKLKAKPIPGYESQSIEGFRVLIAASVLAHKDDPNYLRKPLAVLKSELRTVASSLPPQAVRALRSILIWVEWYDADDPDIGRYVARYDWVGPDPANRKAWGLRKNKHPLKSNNVEIINMQELTREHQPNVKWERCLILHELAHAVHFQLFGAHNDRIRLVYQQAMDRRLYDSSRNAYGLTVANPYAHTNEKEYFAELTCAYFNRLDYYPFTREDLRKHDPGGHKLMELVWTKGKPRVPLQKRPAR